MGLFSFIKEAIEVRKAIKSSVKDYLEKEKLYKAMSNEELRNLPDDELVSAVNVRILGKTDEFEDTKEGMKALNEKERVFYVLNYLDMEVQNGGLCQFFVNDSRAVAPYVSGYMELVGAEEHKKLYDGFISKYSIDLENLSSFDSETAEEFIEQYDRFPFDEYDDAFYELEPIENYLLKFVKENIENF